MKLEQLKSAYDNKKPAAELDPFAAREGIKAYGVEPGDATHYTVRFEGQCVLVHVGNFDSLYDWRSQRNRVLVAIPHLYEDRPLFLTTVQGNEYLQDILNYLANLALDYDCVEPEGLAHRRSYAIKEAATNA
jgi:hypothetical protein